MGEGDSMKKAKSGGSKKDARKQKREVLAAAILSGVAVLVILVVGMLEIMGQSNFFMQKTVAATVADTKLSPAEYNFYYYRAYLEFFNTMGGSSEFLEAGVPDDPAELHDTVMREDESGKKITWEDFFTARADELIEHTILYYRLAMENGYEITQDLKDQINYEFEEKVWFEAQDLAQESVENYLKNNYGAGMTETLFRKHLEMLFVANAYSAECKENVPIPVETLDDYYRENADDCAVVTYRMFYLNGKGDTDAQQRENMEKAKKLADKIAAEAKDEQGFADLCRENAGFNTADSYWQGESVVRRSQTRYALSHVRKWVAGGNVKPGDTLVAQANNGYYVVMFLDRNDNSQNSVNLLYFTVSGEDAVFNARRFVNSFEKTEKSPEAFFEMSDEIRDLDYNTSNYYQISSITYPRQTTISVPACMQDWCFGENRAPGDTQFFSDGSGKAYVAYFDGYGELCSRVIAANDLREEYFERWESENIGSADVKHGTCFFLARSK